MIKKNYKDVGFVYKGTQVIDKIYKGTDLVFEQGYTREQTGVPPITTTYQAIGKNLKDYKIYGNSIQGKLPDIYQQVEYIESTGTQYIDTGIKLNQDSKIITEIQLTNDGSQPNAMFGSRTSSTENNFECVSSSSSSIGIRIDFQSYETNRLTTEFNNEKNYIVISKTLMQIGERTKRQISYTDFETPYNCYIFYVSGENIYGQKAQMRLYNFKIYQNDVLIKDFIPCYKKINNEIGLYDLVSNTFFTNAGTGVFLKGSNAPTSSASIEIESVGDRSGNLFNKSAERMTGNAAAGMELPTGIRTTILTAGNNRYTSVLLTRGNELLGKTLTISATITPSAANNGNIRFFWLNDRTPTTLIAAPLTVKEGDVNGTFTFPNSYPSNTNGIAIIFSANVDGNNEVGDYVNYTDIMLNLGSTSLPYEPYGYKIPVIVGNTTTNIYLNEPLRKVGNYADYIDFKNQKVFRNVIVNDDTGTQTIENSYTGTTDSSGTSISLPNIPTIKGTTVFEIDTNINASNMYIKYKSK